jgi:hypothetical protein
MHRFLEILDSWEIALKYTIIILHVVFSYLALLNTLLLIIQRNYLVYDTIVELKVIRISIEYNQNI